jgi:short-subunit dehydrogenase
MTMYEPNDDIRPTGDETAEYVDTTANQPGGPRGGEKRENRGSRSAVVTGASSGIGKELAREFVEHGFDLVIAADTDEIHRAAAQLQGDGQQVRAVKVDLSTPEGVDRLVGEVGSAPVDALVVNAGIGVSGPFVETPLESHLEVVDLNVRGAVQLTRRLLPDMVQRGDGGVLFTSSIAATMPGPYMSTYNASKSFLFSFAEALRYEVEDAGVTITALMPGPTDTRFFERADMEDTKVAQGKKDDPADVARAGFEAYMKRKDHIVAGSMKNKIQAAAAKVLPADALASAHAKMSEPGSGEK